MLRAVFGPAVNTVLSTVESTVVGCFTGRAYTSKNTLLQTLNDVNALKMVHYDLQNVVKKI